MRGWDTTKTRHGTNAGHRLHYDLGEEPCDACRLAKKEYDKRRLESPDKTQRNRLMANAQMMAYGGLAARHYEEYRELYTQFRDKLLKDAGLPPTRKRSS